MEKVIPIVWPQLGLVEGWSFSDQPEGSAREYQNVRYQDCITRRLRGGSRAGLSKYLTSALKVSGTKAVGLLSFFVDNRQVTYSAIASGSETTTWSKATPSGKDCLNVKTDRQGNVYALDGNTGIVKFSADGQKLWQLALPTKDPNHVVRALAVDEFDRVYAAVSSGGDQEKAAIWCYEQIPDNKVEQLWEILPKAYTEEMKLAGDKLYTAQNRTDRKKAYVRIYDFIDESDPEEIQAWRVPHPVNSLAVKADGSVIVACEPTTADQDLFWRDRDPQYPESSPDSEDWTLDNLTDIKKRLWTNYRGDTIDQSDVADNYEESVEIVRWRDSSDGLRHLYGTFGDGQAPPDKGPVLATDAWIEHKGVRFNLDNSSAPFQALRSLPNASLAKEFADQQRTILPAYTDSAWALFIVCRPSQSATDTANIAHWLLSQDRDNSTAFLDRFHGIFINATSASGNVLPPTALAGRIYWHTGEVALAGTGDGSFGEIKEGRFDARQDNGTNPDGTTTNQGQVVILTLVCDGLVTTAKSVFRINGSPIDKFNSRANATLRPSYLGIYRTQVDGGAPRPSGGAMHNFIGDILEIVALDRRSRSNAALNVVTFDDIQYNTLPQSQTINDVTLIEGMLAHRYGVQISLPFGTAAANNYPHPFGITGTGQDRVAAPPNQGATAPSTAQGLANKSWGAVVKYDAKGKIVWCANEMELIGGSDRSGGYGYAVALNSDGNIYSVGPQALGTGTDDNASIRLIIDQGADFSIQVADGAWSSTVTALAQSHPRIDVDEFDNLYVPRANGFRVFTKAGTEIHSFSDVINTPGVFAVAVDRRIPDYRSDLTTKTVEHVIVSNTTLTAGDETVFKIRLVSSAQASGPVRNLYSLGVSGGDIVKFSTSGVTAPTGGSGALDSDAKYIQGTTLYKKAYWTDGRQLKFYEPITNAVAEYKCLSAGAIPSRCALIESWRGRIVLARSADEPQNWFLSKKDDPTNWDYFPPVPSEVDAVAGNNSNAGLCPDIINTVVPYSEDWLVFGGDHSIWALVGDPAAGGRLELVTDITGMGFGRPWCKDPNGVLYFLGSRGGLFRWVPGAKPERMSLGRIEQQLQDIDFESYHVKLAWNYQDDGIHIVQCPFGDGGTQVAHWFWEARNDGFAKDIFGTSTVTNIQPTDLHVLDGDGFADRVLLFGCEDGFIRQWDRTAKSDDVEEDNSTPIPIDSFVTIFPIQAGEQVTGFETQFQGLTVVLGDRDDGCRYELFASDEPDSFGIASKMGILGPGRNPPMWDRVVGPYCGLRLRNAAVEERFTFERAYIYASQAGLVRPRVRN